MRTFHLFRIALLLLMAGCTPVTPPAPVASPQAKADAQVGTAAAEAQRAPAPTGATQAESSSRQAAPPTAAQGTAPAVTSSAAKTVEPGTKGVAKAPPPPVQVPKKESSTSEVAKQKEPTLDLASLEQRLKDTKAIGVLTKISLKNQVDDLLSQFRDFYAGKLKTTLAELRKPYDLLVLKVLSLLQDSDATLAAAIVASREAIWAILSDPAKFARI